MPYIVESSLDIGGKIVPFSEHETKKLIKEKEEYLKSKPEEIKVKEVKEDIKEDIKSEKTKEMRKQVKNNA